MYRLIHSNDDFILISKDPGVPFHKGSAPLGLVEKIRIDLQLASLFPVHRLDAITSGLIIFARHHEAAREIAQLFRHKTIEKFYIALAPGTPKKKQGTVTGDMKRGRNGVWILSQSKVNPAVTQFFSYGLGNGLRLYILKPRTGRTHQLRVMMKSLGVAILGDCAYYNASKYPEIQFDRGYLHAFAIRFKFRDKQYTFIDPPSAGIHFQTPVFLEKLSNIMEPWNLSWPHLKPFISSINTDID